MSSEGWVLVSSSPRRGRNGGRRRRKTSGSAAFHYSLHEGKQAARSENSLPRLHKKLQALRQEVEVSEFFAEVREVLGRSHHLRSGCLLDMVCYGIGNFSFSRQAGYQFALLLLLRQYLQLKEPVYIFEPLFTELEREILPSYGCEVIKNNEEAKRPVKKPTLFFMPHVDRCLYSNLLWANWSEESLSNLIILGNSFQHYDERFDIFVRFTLKPCATYYFCRITQGLCPKLNGKRHPTSSRP